MFSLLPEITILSCGILIILLDLFWPKLKSIWEIGGLLALISLLICLIFYPQILAEPKEEFIMIALLNGKYVILFKLILLAGVFNIILLSKNFFNNFKYSAEFIALMFFSTLGMMITIGSNDLIVLFLGMELTAITSYLLSAFLKNERISLEAGLKFFFVGAISTAFLLFGFSLIFGLTGETNFTLISQKLMADNSLPIIKLAIVFIAIAFSFKVTLFPFQLWVADVYEGAPTPVTAWLAAGSKLAGFVALIHLINLVFINFQSSWQILLLILALGSLLFGTLAAILQNNLKRLLAFSAITQAGFILLGVGTFQNGLSATYLYLLTYFVSTLLAFSCVILIYSKINSHHLASYRGLAKKMPFISFLLTLSLLSFIGIPPLAVFWGKFLVFSTLIKTGLIGPVIIGLIITIISAYYYLRIVKKMYLEKSDIIHQYSNTFLEKVLLGSLLLIFIFVSVLYQFLI